MNLETERLILRPMTLEDADEVFEYSKEPNVGPNAGWEPHKSVEETIEIMKMVFIGQKGVFGIVLKETGKMIGSVDLVEDAKRENDKVLMLGYGMSEKYWGQGIMTEATKAVMVLKS